MDNGKLQSLGVRLSAGLGILSWPLLTIAQSGEGLIPRPAYQPGDRWTMTVIDAWRGEETGQYTVQYARSEGDRHVFRTSRPESTNEGRYRTDHDLNVCRRSDVHPKETCQGYLQFPMDPHFRKSFSDFLGADGWEVYEGSCEGRGLETVEVPAGAFSAVRVECHGFWTKIGAAGNWTGRFDATVWYAPAARWNVKTLLVRYLGYFGRLQLNPDFKRMTVMKEYRLEQ